MVDDLLPVQNGQLILGHSATSKNEFWFPLTEKAYAKLNGGFDALNFGNSREAFVDFTGKWKVPFKRLKFTILLF